MAAFLAHDGRSQPPALENDSPVTTSNICLNMIVKDESRVLRRCLDSVRPWIDSWVIIDTGSTDGTQQLIVDYLSDLPGELVELPWAGFGASRTAAVERASSRGGYLLFIDADDILTTPNDFSWPRLSADAYEFEIQYAELKYRRVCLVNSDLPWRFVGVLHEYLECGQPFSKAFLEGPRIQIVGGGARSLIPQAQKFSADAACLEAEMAKNPDNSRNQFYLAQSYRDAGALEKAIAAYDRRTTMGGFAEEVFCSQLAAARISAQLRHDSAVVIDRFLRAFESRPSRVEPLTYLLRYLRTSEPRWHFAYSMARTAIGIPIPNDVLFVETQCYEWIALDEFAIAAYWVGDFAQSRHACERLLASGMLPLHELERVRSNLKLAQQR